MRRFGILVLVTGFAVVCVATAVWFGWGRKSLSGHGERPRKYDPVFWEKFRILNSIGKGRPFTESEMEFVRKSLADPDHLVRADAADALGRAIHDPKQREEAIRLLIQQLKDPKWIVVTYAVGSLRLLNAREALPHILSLLKDPRPEVREGVLWDLGEWKLKETIPFVLPLLHDPDPKVRKQAQETLKQLGYKVK